MSEIKHTFQAGKMNKDLDERLVPNGEYRDALNIEVRTSDGDDAGTVQNLHGNIERFYDSSNNANPTESWFFEVDGTTPRKSSIVGSVADERTNKAYFFVASPPALTNGTPNSTKLFKDMIVEYDNVTKRLKPIVIDIFEIHSNDIGASTTDATVSNSTMAVNLVTATVLRPGMYINAISTTGSSLLSNQGDDYDMSMRPMIKSISGTTITFDRELTINYSAVAYWKFRAESVLNFHRYTDSIKNDVTGINIIDNMLLWTDNYSEPKKINIDRCRAGSNNSFELHTKLMIADPESPSGALTSISNIDTSNYGDLKEEHITVIKRAPWSAPKLIMSNNTRGVSLDISGVCEQSFVDSASPPVQLGSGFIVTGVSVSSITLYVGDIVKLNNSQVAGSPEEVRARVHALDSDGNYDLEIITTSTGVSATHLIWNIKLEQEKPLFELKLGRFSYRYLYQDGEYSSFAPWSEVAFLPGNFDYIPKKGYNLGMVNELRDLKITNFVVNDELRPDDVVAVDILYKNTESPNTYVVKTIKRGLDAEWANSGQFSGSHSGILQITSEMIHRTLPSSQLLRAWDNVPRVARAQEVTGNRVVYANYLQNYDILKPVAVYPELIVNEHANPFPASKTEEAEYGGGKSIKSIRRYKIGVVYGDKYGRETPVVGIGGFGRDGMVPGDVYNGKENSDAMTKLAAHQQWQDGDNPSTPPSWMEYFKYYVKETTNEYYNLVMDRWYNAEDGNVWLSFQSSDRNKLNEPDEYNKINGTYITLKNKHGSNIAVDDEARYKVLAIENEAPDFIKTTRKILGSLPLSSTENSLGSDLETAMFATFSSTAWATMFEGLKFEGIGYARIRGVLGGQFGYTEWVKISRMNDASKTINVIKPFGEGADMAAVLGAGATYSLEVKDDVVENRPEFDGRFFVKVYKDAVLAENVLGATDDSLSFNTIDSFSFKMIHGKGAHPASSGTHHERLWNQGSWGYFGGTIGGGDDDDPNKFGDCLTRNNTKDFWRKFGNKTWFIDSCHLSSGARENAPNRIRRGMHHDTSQSISDMNSIHFSIRKLNAGSGDTALFKEKMTTVGTTFRFEGDPNEEVYVVKADGGDWTTSGKNGNWDGETLGASNCNGRTTTNGSTQRHTFKTVFAKVSDTSKGLMSTVWDPRGEIWHNGRGTAAKILIVKPSFALTEPLEFNAGNAIWETEPTEDVGLDLYYEATSAIPMVINDSNNELFAPLNSMVTIIRPGVGYMDLDGTSYLNTISRDIISVATPSGLNETLQVDDVIRFTRPDGTVTESKILNYWLNPASNGYEHSATATGYYRIDRNSYNYRTELPWFNCYSFGNGLESDRIRDDYNAPTIDNGVKVSTTLEDYGEERRANGLIYSGIYNSTSAVNNLNEFNMAEAITKDLNPSYGSIQALKSRDTNVVAFCEDKVLKILSNKDALFNSDGSKNLTASSNVLGDAIGFSGDYGISSNPESLAVDGYRMYFTDKQRNKVLRLSQDGLTPISDIGMTSWFRDNLKPASRLVGSFDEIKGEYNLSLIHIPDYKTSHAPSIVDTTLSFSEKSKGWVSFKSFVTETGLSINDEYLTAREGRIWSHHDKTVNANTFYNDALVNSTIDILFNDNPGSIKSFGSINYEGSQAKVTQDITTADGNYYNLASKEGWFVSSFNTNEQECDNIEFIEKEGKWFNYIKGATTTLANLDTSEFSVQGLGEATASGYANPSIFTLTITEDGN